MKNPKRQPDAARRAKLTIQRRTLALLLVFGVVSFAALFAKAYDLTINQSDDLQKRAAAQQTRSTSISASRAPSTTAAAISWPSPPQRTPCF